MAGDRFTPFLGLEGQVFTAEFVQIFHFLVILVEMAILVGQNRLEKLFGDRVDVFGGLVGRLVVIVHTANFHGRRLFLRRIRNR